MQRRAPQHPPAIRVRTLNEAAVDPRGSHVLYWMIANRRTRSNFALDHALAWASELGRPLVVLEPLRVGYRWAADRHHAFVLAGMRDNAAAFARARVGYHPYVEPTPGHGRGLLAAAAASAAIVVTDDHPGFHYPHMLAAAARVCPVRIDAVDAVGLMPLRASADAFPTAYAFRRHLQRTLPAHLAHFPAAEPLARHVGDRPAELPAAVRERWPAATPELLAGTTAALSRLPIDHEVGVVEGIAGGELAALQRVRAFVGDRLDAYGERRSHPDDEAGSGLSPYLHFGHLGTHAVLRELATRLDWTPASVGEDARGAKEGWWHMPPAAEAFLDELVTWRELGHNFAATRDDIDRYESLPRWALQTLSQHEGDPRQWTYTRERLEHADTHDEVWNAAQRQLRTEGRIHNYLRMLWGKNVLAWSPSPRVALDALIELNNRWALDGRDPNSYSGIFWTLGRYDRPWGPERPVFGTVRYMTSAATLRKLDVKQYLARHGANGALF